MGITILNIGLSFLSRNRGNAKTRHDTALEMLSYYEGRSVTDDDILREEGGRPYFQGAGNREQGTDFNISHSEDIVAVSYVKQDSLLQTDKKLRTGCDVQIIKERANTLRIADQFFYPAEKEYILSQKEKGNNLAFFEIWALKESFIKLHGLSVFDMDSNNKKVSIPDFSGISGRLNLKIDNTSYFLYKLSDKEQNYTLAAAIDKNEATPSIKWFSDKRLTLLEY